MTKTKGTKEWCDQNVNLQKGCRNDCLYCYAKWSALHYKRISSEDEWEKEIHSEKERTRFMNNGKRYFVHSTHDIFPDTVNRTINLVKLIVEGNNEVLITTKPSLYCIKILCDQLQMYKSKIQFRFTITTDNNGLIEEWEGKSPLYYDRLSSLKYAYCEHYKTSISAEPYLSNPINMFKEIEPFVTESIWLGIMNENRLTKRALERYKLNERYFNDLYSVDFLTKIMPQLKDVCKGKLRLKDSVQHLLNLNLYGN